MNLKDIFTRLFGTKSLDLISPNDLESMPKRNILSEQDVIKLDELIETYRIKLSQRRFFLSHDLANKKHDAEMLMYSDLFEKIVLQYDNCVNVDMMEYYEKREFYVHENVNPIKIMLYICEMEKLYKDTCLTLIALIEICEDKEFMETLSKSKIRAILNTIYNLKGSYVVYRGILQSALIEVRSYIARQEFTNCNEELMIKPYLDRITKFARELIPIELNKIEKMNLSSFDKIAHIEKKLEIYAYNSISVEEINASLEEIDSISKIPENRDKLLNWIDEIETKALVLKEYGKYDIDVKPLYQIKFDILTIDIIHQDYSPFYNITDKKEFKYYENIIADYMVTNIIGADSLLSQWAPDKIEKIMPVIVRILKDDYYSTVVESLRVEYDLDYKNYYDYERMLTNTLLLSLILSIKSEEDLKDFFDNYEIKCTKIVPNTSKLLDPSRYMSSRHNVHWENILIYNLLPGNYQLKSICELESIFIGDKSFDTSEYVAYAVLYKELFPNKIDIIEIPEGVTEIDLRSNYDYSVTWKNVFNIINNKTIIMPSTLKKLIIGDELEKVFQDKGLKVPKIIFNEGFEQLETYYYNRSFDIGSKNMQSLTIPSTLSEYYYYKRYNCFCNIPELVFKNCESSKILNNDKSRKAMLDEILEKILDEIASTSFLDSIANNSVHYNKIVLISSDGVVNTLDFEKVLSGFIFSYHYGLFTMQHYNKEELNRIVKPQLIDNCDRYITRIINGKNENINSKKYVKK